MRKHDLLLWINRRHLTVCGILVFFTSWMFILFWDKCLNGFIFLNVALNCQYSTKFCLIAAAVPNTILEPNLFLIFIEELPDSISTQIGIYTDDPTFHLYLNFKSKLSYRVQLAADLKYDIHSVVNCSNLLILKHTKDNCIFSIIWENTFWFPLT